MSSPQDEASLINFFPRLIEEVGRLTYFLKQLIKVYRHRTRSLTPLIIEQLADIAYQSLSIVLFTGFFVGAILIIQFHLILVKYDALSLTGGLSTSAILREIGPLLISFLIAAKIGSYTTAVLGTMKITEQIDAMDCLGVNPLEYLVIPRFVAIILATCLLLFLALLVGVTGSIMISQFFYGINHDRFVESIPRFVNLWTLCGSLYKASVYGFIIATVCTCYGYQTTGGARGVGIAVTKTATYNGLLIVLANSFTTFFWEHLQSFVQSWMR
jgi:phospholipid/cholesterol/gamma-HCH transport system permease protein